MGRKGEVSENAAPAPESIRGLIRKIHTLSLRGVGGEAEAAKRKLNALLVKYSISLDDVLQDVMRIYEFSYKTELERRLIVQCYSSLGVENSKTYEFRKAGRRMKIIGFDLTPAQYIDLKGMVDYYLAAFKKETDRLFMAFVQQHQLYSPSPDAVAAGSTMSQEEIWQIMAMMRGLGEKTYFKPAALLSE